MKSSKKKGGVREKGVRVQDRVKERDDLYNKCLDKPISLLFLIFYQDEKGVYLYEKRRKK